MSNTQRKLDKNRPPRVHISYDVEVGGSNAQKELPLVIGVMGEFAGDDVPLKDRRFIQVDRSSFNQILKGLSPNLNLLVNNEISSEGGKLVVDLNFESLDDFSPDNIIQKIEPLAKLAQIRSKLSDLKTRVITNDLLKDNLQQLVNKKANLLERNSSDALLDTPEMKSDDEVSKHGN